MDRTVGATEENARALPNLLDGLNIEATERSLGGSIWMSDTTFHPPPYLTNMNVYNSSHSPAPSPSGSVSRSQARAPRRAPSSGPEAPNAEGEPVQSSLQFDPPSLRSIFASGQPTSSVSVNTAQASMSTASPGNSSRPFAALTSATSNRRRDIRPSEIASSSGIMPQNTDYTILESEKDVDDPTTAHLNGSSDVLGLSTPQTLSNLFATSDRSTPGQLSREPTYGRSMSSMTKIHNDVSTLNGHLLQLGFEEGRHSDILIKAFGKSYRLHKLLLDRVPYFSSAFCGPWAESSASEMALDPEDIDPNITQTAFELAVRRIYGTINPYREEQEAIGLFATGCWLDMPDLVESCIEHILRQMHPSSLHELIKLVTNSYYGKAGDRILSSAKAMLCRDGWEMSYEYWDNIPADIIREIIGGDPFYVPSEWERWYLTLKILNRRLRKLSMDHNLVSADGKYILPPSTRVRSKAIRPNHVSTANKRKRSISKGDDMWTALYLNADVLPLLNLLDEGIHYVHLRFEQLQLIRLQKDIIGVPLLPDKVISDALWMSMELRQTVLNAHEGDLELGLSQVADSEDDEEQESTPVAQTRSGKGKQREHSQDSTASEAEVRIINTDTGPRKFWIPNNDVSCIMGGSREAYATSTFAGASDTSVPHQRSAATPEITDSGWAADLGSSLFDTSLSTSRNFATQSLPRYSQYPPFRFCAEFPNPRTLKERKRVYSQTVWYAGSMWNLYIQRVNTTKNQQLGIYLHRAKDKEPTDDPLALTVDDRIGQLEREMLIRRGDRRSRHWRSDTFTSLAELEQEEGHNSSNDLEPPSIKPTARPGQPAQSQPHKTSQSPTQSRPAAPQLVIPQPQASPRSLSAESIPLSDSSLDPPLRNQVTISTIPPYTDTRTTIKTYFKIYSPSKGGRLLSVYESAPDSFNFGKSWGWKSSWMVLDDGMDSVSKDMVGKGVGGNMSGMGDGRLRYMVVIGNV